MAFNIGTPASILTHVRKLASSPASAFRNKSKAGGIWQTSAGLLKFDEAGTVRQVATLAGTETLTNKTFTAPASTGSVLTTPLGVVVALETLFTQIAGNKTHTASFNIPAGATILDILITNTAVWDSDTSATLKAGIHSGDDDCFFTALDVKTIPAAGNTINFAWSGNAHGASVPEIDGGAGAQELGATNGLLYNAAAKVVDVIITDVNATHVAGRTRVTVLYSLPSAVIAPVVS